MSTATATPPNPSTPHSPGVLRGGAHLELHTRQACRLIEGRRGNEGPAIIGLLGFAALARLVWTSAAKGDPYADWWLIQIEERLYLAEAVLADVTIGLDVLQAERPRLQMQTASSVKPKRVEVTFGTPLAYRATNLLASYDLTVARMQTAKLMCLLEVEEHKVFLRRVSRAVRGALCSPTGYIALGITREDVLKRTGLAQVAGERMPGLPDEVFNGILQAERHPRRSHARPPLQTPSALTPPASLTLAVPATSTSDGTSNNEPDQEDDEGFTTAQPDACPETTLPTVPEGS